MNKCILTLLLYFFINIHITQAQEITVATPATSVAALDFTNVPESELSLPVKINLQPFFNMANKQVDTLFTSPNYPNSWVQAGCDVRYKYSFRRGPLQFDLKGNTLNISFTGYYKIIGSSRGCVSGTAITPWTPSCQCGFEEGERKVNVSFKIDIYLITSYQLRMFVKRNEPVAVDKCSVCFWGQDITNTIMQSLKNELDISKKELEAKYNRIDLKPYFQKVWDQLQTSYNINNMGWLAIQPQKIRVNRMEGKGQYFYINLGLSAKPMVSFNKPAVTKTTIPIISDYSRNQGFNINVDALLQYDSLSQILTRQIAGKEYNFRKAFVNKKFIFQECTILGADKEKLLLQVKFTGTDNGYFYVKGTPAYDAATRILSFTHIDFDIQSKDALLKTANWLFSNKITKEIEKQAQYNITSLVTDTKKTTGDYLNKEYIKGMQLKGSVKDISVAGIYPQQKHLVIRLNSVGNMDMNIDNVDLSL